MRDQGAEQSGGTAEPWGAQHGEPGEGRQPRLSVNKHPAPPARDGGQGWPPSQAGARVTASTTEPWPGKAAGNGNKNGMGGDTGRRAGSRQFVESWNCLAWKGP